MRRGEVWRVRIPYVPGHTQGGERPAVIIQDDKFNATLPTILVVPFTSSLTTARFTGTLLVQPDQHNGLSVPSVALVFQCAARDKQEFVRPLGTLAASTLNQILDLLDKLTGQ